MTLRATIGRIIIVLVVIFCVVYACDDLSARFNIPRSRQVCGTVTIKNYYAVPQKNGRVQYMFKDTQDETCVNSLFPHFGYTPCWYLNRHKDKWINV
ncbi:MAG TPA: hypothetical protein VFC63_06040 [Blastocatellia bacterium]|nr:hypothetical protein [Blastocatellia bacterium]